MLPSERGEVFEQLWIHSLPVPLQAMGSPFEVDRIPEHDGGGNEVESAGAVALLLEAAVADPPQPVEEHRSRERVARFALVQPGVDTAAQFDTLQPIQHEECAFDTAKFA